MEIQLTKTSQQQKNLLVDGWTNPFEKIFVKMGSSSPNFRGENNTTQFLYIYCTTEMVDICSW